MENKVQIKQLSGALNLDDPLETVAPTSHVGGRNIYFAGTPPNRKANVVQGVLPVVNSLLPSTGVNKTIFEKYDQVNKRIYFANYNSGGAHGIYSFDTVAQTFSRLIQVGVNTSGDPLAFTAETIYNIDIIYGDSTQGDILYFIDSLGRPTKININRALTGGYGTILRSYLDVAKEPSDLIPYVTYENDPSNTVNGLHKKLFRIKIRQVFDDLDKSVTSSQSAMPLPYSSFDQSIDTDPTKNCRLAIVYQTGPANVKKIEIYAANSDGNQMSDFYLIESIDKSAQNIPDNDIATYLFYNDKAYTTLNTTESNQLLDYVPQQAIAQSTLNGNVIAYANITEGYPNLTNFSDGTNTSAISASAVPYYYGDYYSQFVAYQQSVLSSNIHIVVRGSIIGPGNNYNAFFSDNSSITYAVSSGDDAAAVIEGLRVNAIANGFTIVSNSSNDLYISKLGVGLSYWNITNSTYSLNSVLFTSFNAYDWNSKYGFGLIYFDPKGRTNGAVYTTGFSVQSNSYTEGNPTGDITKFNASIYHQPPDWAYYYQWVRTKNLNKAHFVQWVTDRTFKDLNVASGLVKYAYLGIEALRQFVINNPGSPLAYSYSSGDRIRFFKRINPDNTTATLYGNTKDFEVVASLIDPVVNGEVKQGQFIKIILPNTDGSFDFGATGFDNYFIELYTPAQPIANNLNLYYEFGERYSIGDPTLSSRYHHGMLQDQLNFVHPATFEFFKGDDYVRLRSIQTGNIYTWNIPNTNANGFRFLVPLNFQGSTYNDSNIVPHSVSYAGVGNAFNPATDNRWFQSATLITTFKIGGSFSVTFPTARSGDSWRLRVQNRFGDSSMIVPAFDASNAGTYTFPLPLFYNADGSITQTINLANDHIFLLFECVNNNSDRQCTFLQSNVTLTVDHVITQRCIDPNFSDYYASAINSNGRAWVFDENANRINYPTQIRWSLPYQQDTQINMTSRFYPENFDTLSRSNGPIMAMRDNIGVLTYFQYRRCGWTRVYGKYITDSEASGQLTTTDSIISPNNTSYYDGNWGVGNQPTSIVQSGYVYYFVDPVRRKILRLSRDGITELSTLYKVQTWASQNIPKYLSPGTYRFGGSQKILGTFNYRQDNIGEYWLMAQGTASVNGESFVFEEQYNAFNSFVDCDCDAIVCAEDVLYAFRNGVLYKQGGNNVSGVFFGTQYQANLKLSFNDQIALKKVFQATGFMSNATWVSDTKGDVATNHVNPQTFLGQESLIMTQDYDISENPKRYASFNFDQNSMTDAIQALWNGDYLVGEYISVLYKYGSNAPSTFFAPFITWQLDGRNP
jgi:hypothetical protein